MFVNMIFCQYVLPHFLSKYDCFKETKGQARVNQIDQVMLASRIVHSYMVV